MRRMSSVELNEAFLAKIAGWEAMKMARALLATDKVLSSNWTPPILKGVVQEGGTSYRAGLAIKDTINIENMCSCRQSRDWGAICAHSVAVGLHHLRRDQALPGPGSITSKRGEPAMIAGFGSKAAAPPKSKSRGITMTDDPTQGESAELHVIFPPNLEPALAKGKCMICFEAEWNGRRQPLNTLSPGKAFHFAKEDRAVIGQAEALAGGETPAMLMLGAEAVIELLPTLAGHPRMTLGKTRAVTVKHEPWRLSVLARLESSGEIVLTLKPVSQTPALIVGKKIWVYRNEEFRPCGLPSSCLEVLRGPVRFNRSQIPQFLSQEWPQLQAGCDVEANFTLDAFTLEPQAPRFLLALTGGLAQLQAQLQCAYGARIMTVGVTSKDESHWLPDPANPTRYSTRDLGAELAALGRLLRSGFAGPDGQGRLQLSGQNGVLNFFAREFPKLEREWTVTLEERLERSTRQNLERIEPRFEVTSSGVQWFDLAVSFSSASGERFSAAEIQRLVLSGQSHVRLKNGRTAVIDTGAVEELREVLLDCSPDQHAQGYRINSAQAGFVESTLRQQPGWQIQAPSAWRDRAAKQSGETKMSCPPLGPLESVLRPYQKEGVAWLHFLRENGFGGILADEMGLGKTLQTLAYLATINREPGRPTLVVCPTSLVFNWLAEAAKFTPQLKTLRLHGADRHALFDKIAESDLVVTSYALVRRDAEKYRGIEFDTVVLDEAQHIKNRQTQNAQAVKAIRSRHRLVLTGTPLENSVLDLWSIFDFLMPGYLGAARDFKERYEIPITREKNVESQARLGRRLRPFILRRMKRDVAKDLPEKLEQVAYCELTDDQRTVYRQIMEMSRKEVLDAVGARGVAKSRMVVLNALLRLRQICCDLRLLKLEEQGKPVTDEASGKLEMFGELLDEALDGGHRVLVFSQFVSMLTLLKEKLTKDGVEFCYLDGSTSNRADVVSRFQTTGTIPVFLISLKAGGVGLNLTGADTVIHFDPWWNPAVEDQATDRAHRIGQTRVVTSYKLIARDTVEEKILILQNRKREIIKSTLEGGEGLTEALSWEEIQELFG